MQLTIIIPRELINPITNALPTATVSEGDDEGGLGLGQSVSVFIAMQELWKRAKEVCAKLAPFIAAKPELELMMEGPGGKVSIKLKNVSERLIRESAKRAMDKGRSVSKSKEPRRKKSRA